MSKTLKNLNIKSSANNRSGIVTENMTSATADKVVGTTFKNVLVNETGEQVVGPEVKQICELETITQEQADTLTLEDIRLPICGTGDSDIDGKTVTLDKVSSLISGGGASTAPVLGFVSVNDITQSSADASGTIISNGGDGITSHGFVYYFSGNPTHTIGSPGVTQVAVTPILQSGNITTTLTSLVSEENYCVRSYAINASGTSYGSEQCFITDVTPSGDLQALSRYQVRKYSGGFLLESTNNVADLGSDLSTYNHIRKGGYILVTSSNRISKLNFLNPSQIVSTITYSNILGSSKVSNDGNFMYVTPNSNNYTQPTHFINLNNNIVNTIGSEGYGITGFISSLGVDYTNMEFYKGVIGNVMPLSKTMNIDHYDILGESFLGAILITLSVPADQNLNFIHNVDYAQNHLLITATYRGTGNVPTTYYVKYNLSTNTVVGTLSTGGNTANQTGSTFALSNDGKYLYVRYMPNTNSSDIELRCIDVSSWSFTSLLPTQQPLLGNVCSRHKNENKIYYVRSQNLYYIDTDDTSIDFNQEVQVSTSGLITNNNTTPTYFSF